MAALQIGGAALPGHGAVEWARCRACRIYALASLTAVELQHGNRLLVSRHMRSPSTPRTPGGLEQRLLARARAAALAPGDRLLVAFSGGRDSLALAAALRRVEAVLGVRQQLLHVDHRLRPESAEDARRAAALAAALGLDMQAVTITAPPQETHPGVGLEEAARRERHRLLFAAAHQLGARAVVTAHHQDDQAETVLLHLLRGGGLHGALGMAEITYSPFSRTADAADSPVGAMPASPAAPVSSADPGNTALPITHHPSPITPWLWRPFFPEPRATIEAYVAQLGLTPLEDPSNQDRTLRRNALRHEILPLLEQHFPGAKAALARYAMLAAADDQLLEELAATTLSHAMTPHGGLIAARLRAQPLALRRRIVRQWLAQITGSSSFTADRTDAIITLAREKGGGAIEIGEGWTVLRQRGLLSLTPSQDDIKYDQI